MQKFISVGIDIGSNQHQIAIMNPKGQVVMEFPIPHRYAGFKTAYQQVQAVADQYKLPVIVGIEGYNGYAAPFDQYLIAQGLMVKQINNLTLNRYRELFGQPYKTDEYDARLIASYLQQPLSLKNRQYQENQIEQFQPLNREIKLICRHQRDLIKEQTRGKNKLRKLLLSYFPELFDIYKNPFSANCLALIALGKSPVALAEMKLKRLAAIKAQNGKRGIGFEKAQKIKKLSPLLIDNTVNAIITANYAKRIIMLERQIQQLDIELAKLLDNHPYAQLLQSVPGIGLKTASRIIGETMNISRFKTLDKYCAYSGLICLRNDSGKSTRIKRSKKANLILKDTYMKIALTSLRVNPLSTAYYNKKRKDGHSHISALKCLAHQICKVTYKLMNTNATYQVAYKKAA